MAKSPLQNFEKSITGNDLHSVCYESFRGKVEGMALDLNKSISAIYKWMEDPESSGSPIPGNLIIPACKSAGNTLIVEWLANRLGLIVYRIPESSDKGNFDRLAKLTKEFSEALESVGDALLDGKITQIEFNRIEKEFLDLITEGKSCLEALRGQVKK